MYINSNQIKVFPSAKRNHSNDPFSRLMSESTLVSIVNRLVDTDGFVITESYSDSDPFEFNVFGYYFNVTSGSAITSSFSSNDVIYAVIQISGATGPGQNPLTFQELTGVDNPFNPSDARTAVYEGVDFVSALPSGIDNDPSKHYLMILQKVNNVWSIPQSSQIKFNTDGGII